jgi:hypothetical protein
MFTANLFRNYHIVPDLVTGGSSASTGSLQPPSLKRNESLEDLIDTDYDEKREERGNCSFYKSLIKQLFAAGSIA